MFAKEIIIAETPVAKAVALPNGTYDNPEYSVATFTKWAAEDLWVLDDIRSLSTPQATRKWGRKEVKRLSA